MSHETRPSAKQKPKLKTCKAQGCTRRTRALFCRQHTAHNCGWGEDEDGNYWTTCGHGFSIIDGTPKQNGMKFCCYCGKPLTTHKERK